MRDGLSTYHVFSWFLAAAFAAEKVDFGEVAHGRQMWTVLERYVVNRSACGSWIVEVMVSDSYYSVVMRAVYMLVDDVCMPA